MANYNKVILIGNLTRDPQLTYLPSQTPVVEFGLAINHRWRGQDGQQRDETCFIDCRMFGKRGEVINQYVRKGQQLMVEGRLQLDTWEGKDGQRRIKHRVFVENFEFLGGGGGGQSQGGYQAPRQSAAPNRPAAPAGEPPYAEPEPPYEEPGEDIPF